MAYTAFNPDQSSGTVATALAAQNNGSGGGGGGDWLDPSFFGYHLGIGNALSGIGGFFGGIAATGADFANEIGNALSGDQAGVTKYRNALLGDVGTLAAGPANIALTAAKTATDLSGLRFIPQVNQGLNAASSFVNGPGARAQSLLQIARDPNQGIATAAMDVLAAKGMAGSAAGAAEGLAGEAEPSGPGLPGAIKNLGDSLDTEAHPSLKPVQAATDLLGKLPSIKGNVRDAVNNGLAKIGDTAGPEFQAQMSSLADKLNTVSHSSFGLGAKVADVLGRAQDEQISRAARADDAMADVQPGVVRTYGPGSEDIPVTKLANLGTASDGQNYVQIAESKTAIPASMFTPTDTAGAAGAAAGGSLVSRLPDPVLNMAAWLGHHLDAVNTKMEEARQSRAQRIAKNVALKEPDVQAGLDAAAKIIKNHPDLKLNNHQASVYAGKLISAESDATSLLVTNLGDKIPEVVTKVRGGELDVPEKIRNDPEVQAAVKRAADLYRTAHAETLSKLAASSRLGNKGLENVDSDEVLKTRKQAQADALAARLKGRAEALDDQIVRERGWATKKVLRARDLMNRVDTRLQAAHDARVTLENKVAADREALHQRVAQRSAAQEAARQIRALRGEESTAERNLRLTEQDAMKADAAVHGARLRGASQEEIAALQHDADDKVGVWADAQTDAEEARAKLERAQGGAMPPPKEETRGGAYSRGLRSGQLDAARMREATLVERKAMVQANLDASLRAIQEHTLPAEVRQAALLGRADAIEGRLQAALETPSVRNVPARWQPIYQAVRDLHAFAADNPAFADVIASLPKTLPDIMDWVESQGVDPTHVSEMSESQVRQLVYAADPFLQDQVGKESSASTRNIRTGRVAKTKNRDFSVQSVIGAPKIDALHEAALNEIADRVQDTARPIPQGMKKPPINWRPMRPYMAKFLGLNPETDLAEMDNMMIPKAVAHVLDTYNRDYSHWAFQSLGKINNAWKALLIKWQPAFYAHHFVRLVMLATIGGARLEDWINAVADIHSGARTEFSGMHVAAPDTEAVGPPAHPRFQAVSDSLSNVMAKMDEWARTADMLAHMRGGEDEAKAADSAMRDLIDYQDGTPMEKQILRAIIPFYSILKGVFKVAARMPVDHPLAYALSQGAYQLIKDKQLDEFGMVPPSAYQDLLDLPGVGATNLTSYNPFKDPQSLTTPWGILDQLNPLLKDAIGDATGNTQIPGTQTRIDALGRLEKFNPLTTDIANIAGSLPIANLVAAGTGLALGGSGVNKTLGQQAAANLGLSTLNNAQLTKLQGRAIPSIAQAAAGVQKPSTSTASTLDLGQALAAAAGYLNPAAFPGALGSSAQAVSKAATLANEQARGTAPVKKSTFGTKKRRSGGGRARRAKGGVSKARIHKAAARKGGGHVKGVSIHRASVRGRSGGRKLSGAIRLKVGRPSRLGHSAGKKVSGGLGSVKGPAHRGKV